jgi:hypothetical protein
MIRCIGDEVAGSALIPIEKITRRCELQVFPADLDFEGSRRSASCFTIFRGKMRTMSSLMTVAGQWTAKAETARRPQ